MSCDTVEIGNDDVALVGRQRAAVIGPDAQRLERGFVAVERREADRVAHRGSGGIARDVDDGDGARRILDHGRGPGAIEEAFGLVGDQQQVAVGAEGELVGQHADRDGLDQRSGAVIERHQPRLAAIDVLDGDGDETAAHRHRVHVAVARQRGELDLAHLHGIGGVGQVEDVDAFGGGVGHVGAIARRVEGDRLRPALPVARQVRAGAGDVERIGRHRNRDGSLQGLRLVEDRDTADFIAGGADREGFCRKRRVGRRPVGRLIAGAVLGDPVGGVVDQRRIGGEVRLAIAAAVERGDVGVGVDAVEGECVDAHGQTRAVESGAVHGEGVVGNGCQEHRRRVGIGAEIGIDDLVVGAEARTAGGRADVGRDGHTVGVGDVAEGDDGAGRNARRWRRPAKTALAAVEGAAGPFAIREEDRRAARDGREGDEGEAVVAVRIEAGEGDRTRCQSHVVNLSSRWDERRDAGALQARVRRHGKSQRSQIGRTRS